MQRCQIARYGTGRDIFGTPQRTRVSELTHFRPSARSRPPPPTQHKNKTRLTLHSPTRRP